ncbi:RodZ family helix-turn-helix domain-containing protein [Zymomonas mobilis]|uniref:helix-turn-helix transcriptional regulator n=1 Tax=Zymomonas mobilis TaxID=542 RepID=UPI0021C312A5|nr:helix-turn-helix transcriptional regulator [Zymomonas mobilis]MCP9308713.1 helix-turn-helix transcriptional regulator [Zymomonas mobilis]
MLIMTRHASSETTKIEKVRQWLREERNSRGWSANRLAKEAKLSAEARGKISDIKQQTISAFENGQTKGIPEWVTFVAAAFEDHPTPSVIKNITEAKCTEASVKLPTQTELRKMLLGLLAPMEIGSPDSWNLKQKIASSLAQRLPIVMTQPQIFHTEI